MSTERRDGLRALHLLWALPIAAGFQFAALFLAKLSWCGMRNCGTHLTNTDLPNVSNTLMFLFLGALLAAIVLVIAPWTKRLRLRFIAPPVYAVIVALACLVGLAIASAG